MLVNPFQRIIPHLDPNGCVGVTGFVELLEQLMRAADLWHTVDKLENDIPIALKGHMHQSLCDWLLQGHPKKERLGVSLIGKAKKSSSSNLSF